MMNYFFFFRGERISRLFYLIVVISCVGCSPKFNWRSINIEEGSIQVLLPCKPEKVKEQINIEGAKVTLTVNGCAIDGVLFAVSTLPLENNTLGNLMVRDWQKALIETTVIGLSTVSDSELSDELWELLSVNSRVDAAIESETLSIQREFEVAPESWDQSRVEKLTVKLRSELPGWTGFWGVRKVGVKSFVVHAIVIGQDLQKPIVDEFFKSVIN